MGFLFNHFLGPIGYLYFPFFVWMLIDCIRNEQSRGIWILLILFLPGFGSILYFFTCYLQRGNQTFFKKYFARFQGRELKQLEIAARQIGNPYHWILFADKLREQSQYSKAETAYRNAIEKEPENIQALWGLAICLENQEQFEEALKLVSQVLEQDPEYKFGDVSIAYARLLIVMKKWEQARSHLETHINRWRQPEGLYLLAQCQLENSDSQAAKNSIEMLIMDIEASPASIARKQKKWKRKAKTLLKSC